MHKNIISGIKKLDEKATIYQIIDVIVKSHGTDVEWFQHFTGSLCVAYRMMFPQLTDKNEDVASFIVNKTKQLDNADGFIDIIVEAHGKQEVLFRNFIRGLVSSHQTLVRKNKENQEWRLALSKQGAS